ncbi:MAG: tRNA uridine-5-carboxymethylaminomethyl(34) synthesis GTPase MnmE [Oscillospiraceae bacterium]|jgi:tRNA modification GTPase|nr:tRNA uridine-5-carboxymethylaminomethyl(34) synthesis GTPase MnmE [Oscillospiraceae bacterium]
MSDTIAAVATAGGKSAIGIVRLSGDETGAIYSRCFVPRSGKAPAFGKLVRGQFRGTDGGVIDDCAAILFEAGHSYTGEASAEFHCHGSPVLLSMALRTLFSLGARQAAAGEFTRRAFLSGRLGLAEAEAVADVIDAESEAAVAVAASQLLGSVARKTDEVYDSLIDIKSHFHAVVDYTDEDVGEFDAARYAGEAEAAAGTLRALAGTFERGRVLRDGIACAITGRPNAGKSTLLNALLGYDRAIVSAEPGTTRDTLAERISVGGIALRLTDTAGIRAAESEAERLGIERSRAAAAASAIVLCVFDGSRAADDTDIAVAAAVPEGAAAIAVVNKSDLPARFDLSASGRKFDGSVSVSARDGGGIAELLAEIARFLPDASDAGTAELITGERQFDCARRAAASLEACAAALRDGVTPDAALSELELALSALAELNGRSVAADTLERVFSRFCVGK